MQNYSGDGRFLGVSFYDSERLGPGSAAVGALCAISHADASQVVTSYRLCTGPTRSAIWDVCPLTGHMWPIWDDGECTYVLAFAIRMPSARIFMVSSYNAYCRGYSDHEHFKGRLVFEAMP